MVMTLSPAVRDLILTGSVEPFIATYQPYFAILSQPLPSISQDLQHAVNKFLEAAQEAHPSALPKGTRGDARILRLVQATLDTERPNARALKAVILRGGWRTEEAENGTVTRSKEGWGVYQLDTEPPRCVEQRFTYSEIKEASSLRFIKPSTVAFTRDFGFPACPKGRRKR